MDARVPIRARHVLVAAGYLPFCMVVSAFGPNPLAGIAIPMYITGVAARGRSRLAAALTIATPAIAGPFAALAADGNWAIAFAGVIWFACIAMAGRVMGESIRQSGTFTRALTWAAGLASIATVVYLAVAWDRWADSAAHSFEVWRARLQRDPQFEELPAEVVDANLEVLDFLLIQHWRDLSFGFAIATVVTGYALWLAFANAWIQWWRKQPGLRSDWTGFRLPDGVAWLAIAGIGLYLANQYWPHDALRVLGWNGSIALAAVYWVNGIAVLYYGLRAYGASRGVQLAVGGLAGLFMFQAGMLLTSVGLFDTWIDFRKRFDSNIAARREREERGDDEW